RFQAGFDFLDKFKRCCLVFQHLEKSDYVKFSIRMMFCKLRNSQGEYRRLSDSFFSKFRSSSIKFRAADTVADFGRSDEKIPCPTSYVQQAAAAGGERVSKKVLVTWLQRKQPLVTSAIHLLIPDRIRHLQWIPELQATDSAVMQFVPSIRL